MHEPRLDSLYQELILDHYRSPRNRGEMEDAPIEVHMRNPTCGDEIKLQMQVEDGRIARVTHTGQGCSISQASVSMLSQLLTDRSLDEARALAERFTEMMHGDESASRDRSLGDLRALAGVSRFPVRVKCALLGFDALQEALKQVEDPPAPS
ncbi:MAG: SUF system NifU family Fe-S cluster assembly protein [Gemmatimonadota bacterium]|jgi:nitrogen fixation NifU-like protein